MKGESPQSLPHPKGKHSLGDFEGAQELTQCHMEEMPGSCSAYELPVHSWLSCGFLLQISLDTFYRQDSEGGTMHVVG